MSDEQLDELAEAARNRGLKLVRSRVRTPTKRRFGKVGLTDKSGKAVFGMDAKGPVGKLEDVELYLRNLGAQDWGASLDVAVLPRKRKTAKATRDAANDREPEPAKPKKAAAEPKAKPQPKPKPPPKPEVRTAKPGDAPRLVELIGYLGHEIDEKALRKNLKALKKSGELPLVATIGKNIVGMCGVGARTVVSRPAPLGRITTVVVDEAAQDLGIGRILIEAAEEWMRKRGCQLVEVTSADRRSRAHGFYRHLGYDRTGIRFVKKFEKTPKE
jgi:ribosomal protein S18 acetylase RimI-like enzyme